MTMTFGDLFSEGGVNPYQVRSGGRLEIPGTLYTPPMTDRGTYGMGGGKGKGKGKPPDSAIAALTLLAFMFFLNILQNCLKETMMKASANDSMNGVGVNIGNMMTPGGPGGINIGGQNPGTVIMLPNITAGRFRHLEGSNIANSKQYTMAHRTIDAPSTMQVQNSTDTANQKYTSSTIAPIINSDYTNDEKTMVPVFTQVVKKEMPAIQTFDKHKVVYISTALKLGEARVRRGITEVKSSLATGNFNEYSSRNASKSLYTAETCIADKSKCYTIEDLDAIDGLKEIASLNESLSMNEKFRDGNIMYEDRNRNNLLSIKEKRHKKLTRNYNWIVEDTIIKQKHVENSAPKNAAETDVNEMVSEIVGGTKPKGEKVRIPDFVRNDIRSNFYGVPQGPPVTYVENEKNYGNDWDRDKDDIISSTMDRVIPEVLDRELMEYILQDVVLCSPFLVCQAKKLAGTDGAELLSIGLAWIHPVGATYAPVLLDMITEDESCRAQLETCQRDSRIRTPLPTIFRLMHTFT